MAQLDLTPADLKERTLYRGSGCDHCNNTGYRGRVGLFELMVMNDDIRELIMSNASTDELRKRAEHFGMVTLRAAGMQTMWDGVTTAEEVIRETIMDV